MSQEGDASSIAPSSAAELDPAQVLYLRQRIESEQNLILGLIGGLGAALVGAILWAGITVVTATRSASRPSASVSWWASSCAISARG